MELALVPGSVKVSFLEPIAADPWTAASFRSPSARALRLPSCRSHTVLMLPQRDEIVRVIRTQQADVVAVYVFGSRARGDHLADSDLDLAVLAQRPIEPLARWSLQEQLANVAGRPVDLVDLRNASTVMRAKVLESAELLYQADPTARHAFEAMALSAYARLNEERRDILNDVRSRGTVYG